jgi:flagellar assembly protein FliH
MPLLKAESPPLQPSSFSMAEFEKQAKAIVAAAQIRGERFVRAAQEEAADIKRRAHATALAEGRRDGLAKGIEEGRKLGCDEALAEQRQSLAQLVSALTQAAEELDAQRIALEAEAKQAVVRLAIAIADKITKRQGALDENVALANIDEALRLVVSSADVRIAVHPTQRAALAETLPRISAKWPNLKHVELIADGTLLPGGCRIFSGGGQIDADLQIQLDRIAAELLPSTEP